MANADLISDSLESVSLHLEAINLLGDVLGSVIEDGGTRHHQYEFCLAFRLLAEAAQGRLVGVIQDVSKAQAFKAELNALSRVAR